VAQSPHFALKGGTALNLFLHDMPRLSVDIDLTYLPFAPYDEALAGIRSEVSAIASRIERQVRASPSPMYLHSWQGTGCI
jgi:predicted nucleotidyltransferase component of viral defense system